MAAVDTDIESFIRQQKAKLANERQTLNNPLGNNSNSTMNQADLQYRRKWAEYHTGASPAFAEQRQETRPVTPIESGLPLTNRGQQDRQRELALQRNKEYNDMLQKKAGKSEARTREGQSTYRVGLEIGQYDELRKSYDKERRHDYANYMENQRSKASSKAHSHIDEGQGGEVRQRNEGQDPYANRYNYQEAKKQLAEERRKEYNAYLQSKANAKSSQQEKEIDAPKIIPFDRVEEDKQRLKILEEERRREYQQVKRQMDDKKQRRLPTPEGTYGLPVGEYEKSRRKEQEQRAYREMLQKQQEEQKGLVLIQQMGVAPEKVSAILRADKQREAERIRAQQGATGQDTKGEQDRQFERRPPSDVQEDYNRKPRVQFEPEPSRNIREHEYQYHRQDYNYGNDRQQDSVIEGEQVVQI